MAIFSRHAVLEWAGEVTHGTGTVAAGSDSFRVSASFPRLSGEPQGVTTPEEMLAASHAICYGLGLRSLISQRGGSARRLIVTATITAEKSREGIRIQSSHLSAELEGLEGLESASLQEIAEETERGCTISNAIRGNVRITHSLTIG